MAVPRLIRMKLLHTADWHLGDRLGRIDRTDDLRRAVDRVADLCRDERVDVLLVAGDLFSELARPDGLREAIRHWRDRFREFLEGGGTILTLTGNHDNENFCQTLVHAMNLAAPLTGQPGELIAPGRLYLATEPWFLRLPDRHSGDAVQFILMPWPTPARFLRESNLHYGSPEEKNQLLVDAWKRALVDLRQLPAYDPKAPAVLSAHINIHGAHIGSSLFRMTPQEDIVIDGSDLAEQFDYVALGHVHKPQAVGAAHVRYSGSIEKMDLGERDDVKSIAIVEIGAEGLIGEPSEHRLKETTPIDVVNIDNPREDLLRLRQSYKNAAATLVNLHIRYTAGVDNLEDVLRGLDELFPRWYARDWEESGELGPSLVAPDDPRSQGFRETVREYLEQELIQHGDADRDAILAIADELMANND
ncbi:MAG TPA: exonuclease SbcCD subunit D [Urbifossiella sp.]|nr:exonuclease SbcCD subunit D [Urbifossiella sp.]